MRCKEFETRLQQVLDQRNPPESDAQLCQLAEKDEMLAAQLKVAELVASPPVVVMYPTANFADRIVSRIREEDSTELRQRNTPVWKRKSFWFAGVGLAAALSVAMVMAVGNFGRSVPEIVSKPDANTVAASPKNGESESKKLAMAQPEFPRSFEDISKRLDVREEKVAELRKGLQPLRSTLNVTIHVFRSTVPNRPHQQQQRPVEGQPSSAILSNRWIA